MQDMARIKTVNAIPKKAYDFNVLMQGQWYDKKIIMLVFITVLFDPKNTMTSEKIRLV
jgi:hypothetical protein